MDQGIGTGEGGVVEARGFGTKEDGGLLCRCRIGGRGCSEDFLDGLHHRQARDGLGAGPGGGGIESVAIGDGLVEGFKTLGLLQYPVSISGGGRCSGVGPTIAWSDQAQLVEAAVEHGAGAHADILPELGLEQDDDGWFHEVGKSLDVKLYNSSKFDTIFTF